MKTGALALAFAAAAYGQTLSEVLSANPDVSNVTQFLLGYAPGIANASNITLLAPTNDAVTELVDALGTTALADAELITALLQYHILQGVHTNISNITFFPTTLNNESYTNVTGGQVVEGLSAGDNITFFSGLLSNSSVLNSTNFTGGVVHTIDRFLMIPTSISETAIALNLTSAVGALGNLSLAEEAESTPDLTVFIPNNEAFQRVGGNLANLSMDNLTDILLYHVIAGQVLYSTSLENDTELETLQGSNLTVTIDDGTVFINNAEVIQPNVLVANGVVHVIDRLLNPNNATAEPNASATEESFPNPTSASDVPFTSGVPTPTSSIATEAATSAQESATSEGGAWRPIETGAMGMAALLGGAAAVMNL